MIKHLLFRACINYSQNRGNIGILLIDFLSFLMKAGCVNLVCSGVLSTVIVPSWAIIISWAIAKPSPVPPVVVERAESAGRTFKNSGKLL